jgi:hypothetical protein
MPPKKTQKKAEQAIDTFLVQQSPQSQKNKLSLSKSKSKKLDYDENGNPIIKLILQENLLKSLNKIYERQNHELFKIISIDKTVPINDLLNFMDDQSSVFIKEIDSA